MIISRAPVRLPLGGGGTDLPSYYEKHRGFLISATIDKYVNILINRRFQNEIRISYSKTEITDNVNQIKHNLFRECMKYTEVTKNVEIVSVSDVPSNSGLGTSSAFTVSLLNALYTFRKEQSSKSSLAKDACDIEIGILKDPIGKQDQYSSAYGGFNAYMFNKERVNVKPVKISEKNLLKLQTNLMLFYFDKSRKAGDILREQNKLCKKNDIKTIDRLNIIKEIGVLSKDRLESGDLSGFGELMDKHWNIKKSISKNISSSAIDEIYSFSKKNGALGGKIIGAGGGGFFMFYSDTPEKLQTAIKKKFDLKQLNYKFEFKGAEIIYK
jgi:D-glycero-alpha-D-manno-heptose-7-phosphate kinase